MTTQTDYVIHATQPTEARTVSIFHAHHYTETVVQIYRPNRSFPRQYLPNRHSARRLSKALNNSGIAPELAVNAQYLTVVYTVPTAQEPTR